MWTLQELTSSLLHEFSVHLHKKYVRSLRSKIAILLVIRTVHKAWSNIFWHCSKVQNTLDKTHSLKWWILCGDSTYHSSFLSCSFTTYCRVASHFILWGASAAFSILAESSLHCSLSLARSVILIRSSVDWSLKWSISPRFLLSTIGRVVVGLSLVCGHIGWNRFLLLCWRGCRCLYEQYAQWDSNGLLEFAARGAFPGIFI